MKKQISGGITQHGGGKTAARIGNLSAGIYANFRGRSLLSGRFDFVRTPIAQMNFTQHINPQYLSLRI
ncbi:hypothetical protein DNI29_09180 [Hymenobacter sediminis]|nr:hypothetical protein DNI29_09180 [Hymenobacter sediminis]